MVKYARLQSLHARIFLVICAAAFPLLIGSGYYLYKQSELVRVAAQVEANQYLTLAAEYAQAEILGAGEALDAISATPSIQSRNWALCNEYLHRLVIQRADRYSNIGVVDLNGNLLCSGVPVSARTLFNFADRTYFQLALKRPGLAVGDYQTGRLTGLPAISVATAMRDGGGKPFAVVFASLRLTSLERESPNSVDSEARITILDRNGVILLASDPLIGRVGQSLQRSGLREAFMARARDVRISTDATEPFRLIGSMSAGPRDDPSAITVLYTSRGSAVFSGLYRDLRLRALAALALIAIAVSAGWTGTNALIGKNIRRIANAAARMRGRDFHTRVAHEVSGSEFQLIAVQLDEMAKELEQREREWMSSIQRQSHQVDLLRRIAQTEPLEGILRSICEFAEEQVPGAQASLLLVDEDRCVTSCIAPKLPKSYCDSLIGIRAVSGAGSCGTAIAERRVIVSEDIESDPLWVDFRTLATSHGLRACWSYPVISTGDRVFGSFALYFNEQRAPRPDELPVSRMAAEVAAVAIDRYQTGEALAQSEAEYRSLFETNPYPMWVSESASGKFLAVNDSAIKHYGFSRETFLAMRVNDLDAPEQHSQKSEPSTESGGERPTVTSGVKLHRDARGDTLEVELAYFPLRFQGRNATLALISDVTYRSALTHTIREQKEFFSLLMGSTVEAICGLDQNGCCTFANAACERLLGYSAQELAGKPMHALIHHTHEDGSPYELAACQIQNSIASGAHVHVDNEVFWRSDGTSLPVEYWAYPIVRDGQVAGSIVTFIETSERRRQQDELRRRATFDDLTGLLNRPSFVTALETRLQQADASERHPVVAILDLDGFKEINDSLGHATGDQLLRGVAERLTDQLGPHADVGRLGGDEFAFVVDESYGPPIATRIEAVMESIRRPFSIAGLDLAINGSVGAARYPGAGLDVDTLLRSADAAMYVAKREGHGFTFTDRVDAGTPRPFLLSELRRALQEDEFILHFQPTIPLQGLPHFGFEALIRWNHPRLGIVGPGEFMPMVEVSDLIHPLTEWVIASAVSRFKTIIESWPNAFVAVNVSMRNLINQKFTSSVQYLVEQNRFPVNCLKIEVTESAVMADPDRTLRALNELHGLGVRIAVDDFGTGYSSLAYLQKLPVDDLKIDRSFVSGLSGSQPSKAIVHSIISLAHSLGLSVTAEGIESEADMRILRAAGCDFGQGYYIGHPMPFDAVHDWLKSRSFV
ncbi:EAL domain-containing protein [Ralstonia sp. 11b]|uniref:EAL domain-containing protein n=1 Tax=Ralstonia sp. 11b TaxID=3063544 RepID=UPI0028702F81|nr:EAL domain-containing protein [Ralstonia sp. 11b]MDR9384087.1 EAL domain-containing protein [Ralstonia sp. 11b]